MKKCIKCGASIEDDANFCAKCGASQNIEMFKECPNCHKKIPSDVTTCPFCSNCTNEEVKRTSVFDSISPRAFTIYCGYGEGSPNTIAGEISITKEGVSWKRKVKSVVGALNALGSLGSSSKMSMSYDDIAAMSIDKKGYILDIITDQRELHCFSGATLLGFSENKACVKKIGCLIELYRRMWLYYGGYTPVHLCIERKIVALSDASYRFDTLSNEELVDFYKSL